MRYQYDGLPKTVFGHGVLSELGALCKPYGKKALLVTGRHSAQKNGFLDTALASLKTGGLETAWFSGVDPDPVIQNVEDGVEAARLAHADMVIALGGGSAIDTAKAISLMASNPGRLPDYEFGGAPGACLPIIAVPTTAGTGSEATKGAVITDEERMVKMGINFPQLMPRLALLDPALTLSLPPTVTAATGFDALTHAIEALLVTIAPPFSKPFALEAIRLLCDNLPGVMADGADPEARANMLLGSYYAGCAISIAATGLVHAMARPLGVYFHVPHGLANAILLTRVMRFNAGAGAGPFVEMAPQFGVDTAGLAGPQLLDAVTDKIAALFALTGLPQTLREVGAEASLLPRLAHDAAVNRSNQINIRVAREDEILEMYTQLY